MEATTTPTNAAQALRAEAAQHDQDAADSFERCDTDGFVSQWASGVMAQVKRLQATITEQGGTYEFPALFDLDGQLVPAKLIDGRYGLCWAILEGDGTTDRFSGQFVTAFPARPSTMARKGYAEGFVRAPARAVTHGKNACNVTAIAIRTDGGWDPNAEVVR